MIDPAKHHRILRERNTLRVENLSLRHSSLLLLILLLISLILHLLILL